MAAPYLAPTDSAVNSLINRHLAVRTIEPAAHSVGHRIGRSDLPARPCGAPSADWIWSSLLESLPQGVIVVSRTIQPIYLSQKAGQFCEILGGTVPTTGLPIAVSEVCQRLLKTNSATIALECQVGSQTLKITASWMETVDSRAGAIEEMPAYMMVMLENCTETLRQTLRLEQQKYDLTDREAEVWMLLRQEFTYQEIAKLLQISLNTVKTHVKNVYAKKRSYLDRDQFWCYG